jgi:hypothetical protein
MRVQPTTSTTWALSIATTSSVCYGALLPRTSVAVMRTKVRINVRYVKLAARGNTQQRSKQQSENSHCTTKCSSATFVRCRTSSAIGAAANAPAKCMHADDACLAPLPIATKMTIWSSSRDDQNQELNCWTIFH